MTRTTPGSLIHHLIVLGVALALLAAAAATAGAREGPVEDAALPDGSPVEPWISSARVPGTNNVELSWEHLSENGAYQVWRGTTPYFDPALGQGNQIYLWDTISGDTLTYPDDGSDYYPTYDPNLPRLQILGIPAVNYFWVVRGQSGPDVSANSNRVGEFDFALVAGS